MTQPVEFLVNVPVTDLRRKPVPSKGLYEKDSMQETQLLLGEKVRLAEEEEMHDWLYVEALEQLRHSSLKGWLGYQGWVQRSHIVPVKKTEPYDLVFTALWTPIFFEPKVSSPVVMEVSLGTRLTTTTLAQEHWRKVSLPDGRHGYVATAAVTAYSQPEISTGLGQKIINEGNKFLGSPYHWGGRSAYRATVATPLTGVDCSGLSNLLYRMQGIDIPRDAHDQFLKCQRKAGGAKLEVGDLIFSMKGDSVLERMDHVMLYAGGDEILEATLTHGQVKYESISKKCGRPLVEIADGERIGDTTFFFGSFLTSSEAK